MQDGPAVGGAIAAAGAGEARALSHNLLGQRLGRKGRDTRERILASAERLLASDSDTPISLSAVARDASLGMTTLYLYFSDLTELLLAVLEPIMASSEAAYVSELRDRWPDDALGEKCLHFVRDFHAFWQRHAKILHLRNTYADTNDGRMREHRFAASTPLLELLVLQMDGDPADPADPAWSMAAVMLTGIERIATVTTNAHYPSFSSEGGAAQLQGVLAAEARLIELGVRDLRAGRRGG